MKYAEFEKELRQTLHNTSPVSRTHLEQTARLAGMEARQRPGQISFSQFLTRQIRFMGWKLWAIQGALLLVIVITIGFRYGGFFWEEPWAVAKLLSCLSALVAMSAIPLLYRSARYRMQEIEAAAYFSSGKLLMAKLAVIGLGDSLLLAGIFVGTVCKTSLQMGNAALCLLLPFLLITSGELYLLGHWPADRFFYGSLALGGGLLCIAISGQLDWLLSFSPLLLAICAGLVIFCAGQCRQLCRNPQII